MLSDIEIRALAKQGMIRPYVEGMVRVCPSRDIPVLSYGQGSYGYDIRLSPISFQVLESNGGVLDPKAFDPECLVEARLHQDASGEYFILPPHTYGLGVSWERLDIPSNITVTCLGKSTYARLGLIVNVTPAEAGWRGNLTLEISNSSDCAARIYASEGICQLFFHKGNPCSIDYQQRNGKYQDQGHTITHPKV